MTPENPDYSKNIDKLTDEQLQLLNPRLSSIDSKGHVKQLSPPRLPGKFRTLRDRVYWPLMALFLIVPWLTWNSKPFFRLEIFDGKVFLLGHLFLATDAPSMLFIFGGALFSLFFISALFGRAWCGWACPQTVWVDGVYRRLEHWIEGNTVEQRKLSAKPWGWEKIQKRGSKLLIFVGISAVLAYTFVGYFSGMPHFPSTHPTSFLVTLFFTALITWNLGFFREQFCIVACPYGRIQSVLMDPESMVIGYDSKRGEPRRGHNAFFEPAGDCTNCLQCVRVCPTGIDIRDGVQMDCIACTACIDGCNATMRAVGRPENLIRLTSYSQSQNKSEGLKPYRVTIHFRSWIYLGLMVAMGIGLVVRLSQRAVIDGTFLRDRSGLFAEVLPGVISNQFKMHLQNQSSDRIKFRILLSENGRNQGLQLLGVPPELELESGAHYKGLAIVQFPTQLVQQGKASGQIEVLLPSGEVVPFELQLIGPR